MEQLLLPLGPPPDITELFRRVFSRMRIKTPVTSIAASYYPFAGLRSTISVRHGVVKARVSDLLSEASPLVLEALAEILLARVFRRRPSREARECYLAYTLRPAVRERIDATRRARGAKRHLPPRGRHHDLEEVFESLNRRFFEGRLPAARIGWSRQNSRRILGHYDSSHHSITISRVFDSASVPLYLVEYIVYHEMLHIRFPVERNGHRRVVHSREFREAEKQFPKYELACRQIKRLCS